MFSDLGETDWRHKKRHWQAVKTTCCKESQKVRIKRRFAQASSTLAGPSAEFAVVGCMAPMTTTGFSLHNQAEKGCCFFQGVCAMGDDGTDGVRIGHSLGDDAMQIQPIPWGDVVAASCSG